MNQILNKKAPFTITLLTIKAFHKIKKKILQCTYRYCFWYFFSAIPIVVLYFSSRKISPIRHWSIYRLCNSNNL